MDLLLQFCERSFFVSVNLTTSSNRFFRKIFFFNLYGRTQKFLVNKLNK